MCAKGGKSRDSRTPFVEVEKDFQSKGLPKQLDTLGPLECYEMMLELMAYLKKVADQPALLLQDDNYDSIFTTKLYKDWWHYNRLVHSQGGGKTAADKKTKKSFWEETRKELLKYAVPFVDTPLFAQCTKLFCNAFCSSIRPKPSETGDNTHDYGWFDKLEENDNDDNAARRPTRPSMMRSKNVL